MLTIYVADRDAAYRRSLVHALRRRGVRAVEFANGSELYASARAGRPDLVVLETDLDEMDGFQVFARLLRKRVERPLPLVFLSDFVHARAVEICLQRGALAYLPKGETVEATATTLRDLAVRCAADDSRGEETAASGLEDAERGADEDRDFTEEDARTEGARTEMGEVDERPQGGRGWRWLGRATLVTCALIAAAAVAAGVLAAVSGHAEEPAHRPAEPRLPSLPPHDPWSEAELEGPGLDEGSETAPLAASREIRRARAASELLNEWRLDLPPGARFDAANSDTRPVAERRGPGGPASARVLTFRTAATVDEVLAFYGNEGVSFNRRVVAMRGQFRGVERTVARARIELADGRHAKLTVSQPGIDLAAGVLLEGTSLRVHVRE